jgi:hypothetical protein
MRTRCGGSVRWPYRTNGDETAANAGRITGEIMANHFYQEKDERPKWLDVSRWFLLCGLRFEMALIGEKLVEECGML